MAPHGEKNLSKADRKALKDKAKALTSGAPAKSQPTTTETSQTEEAGEEPPSEQPPDTTPPEVLKETSKSAEEPVVEEAPNIDKIVEEIAPQTHDDIPSDPIAALNLQFTQALVQMNEGFAMIAEQERERIGEVFGKRMTELTKNFLSLRNEVAEIKGLSQELLKIGGKVMSLATLDSQIEVATKVVAEIKSEREGLVADKKANEAIRNEIVAARDEIKKLLAQKNSNGGNGKTEKAVVEEEDPLKDLL